MSLKICNVVFNFLFSNGDAHLKNFSIIETPLGDFKLSPAYDLLNSRIHIEDKDFVKMQIENRKLWKEILSVKKILEFIKNDI